jgi:serine-type D-Ala-D-Ala carboxypeptidase (penicillin-binding protein 5/6)
MKPSRWLLAVGAVAMITCGAIGPRQAAARRVVLHTGPNNPSPAATGEAYRAAILIDADSGMVLAEKDPHRQSPPASMTKMMLMLLVAERVREGSLHWDDPIVTSAWASHIGGSQVYLKQGEVFPLSEMMQAICIHSANDAAVAVAEAVAGSSGAFVDLMNQRAKQLGMHDTVYHSVHGLPPAKGQRPDLSSAYDLALLARELVKAPEIMQWAGTRETSFRGGTLTLSNTNRLVKETNWVDGLKTGYYREAGFNVTATGKRDEMRLIAVILGAADKHECFSEAAKLLNRGFADYKALVAVKEGDTVASDVAVDGGKPRFVRVVAGGNVSVVAKRGDKRTFSLELTLADDVHAPLSAKDPVGELVVKEGDVVIGKVPALAAEPVAKTSLWDRLF